MILNNGDIILISAIDEIPRDSRVAELASLLTGDTKIVIFKQIMTKFFLNNISQVKANNTPWLDTVACTYGVVKGILPQGTMIGDLLSPDRRAWRMQAKSCGVPIPVLFPQADRIVRGVTQLRDGRSPNSASTRGALGFGAGAAEGTRARIARNRETSTGSARRPASKASHDSWKPARVRHAAPGTRSDPTAAPA
jgi:hypothetical protein